MPQLKDLPEEQISRGITCSYIVVSTRLLITGKTSVILHQRNIKQSAISDHLLQYNCVINFDDFDILPANPNTVITAKGEFINKTCPIYLKQYNLKSFPLDTFD